MPTIAEVRKQYADLKGLDDEQVVDAVHQALCPDMSRDFIAGALGYKVPDAEQLSAEPTAARAVTDALPRASQFLKDNPGLAKLAAAALLAGVPGVATADLGQRALEWFAEQEQLDRAAAAARAHEVSSAQIALARHPDAPVDSPTHGHRRPAGAILH